MPVMEAKVLAPVKALSSPRPPNVQARNPVGAGDALLAGIAWAVACPESGRREKEMPLEEMARWGVACGKAAAVREGVSVGTRTEVEALYAQVQIDQVIK